MEITREILVARRERLTKEQEQLILTWTALGGAIQDIDYWLEQLEKGEEVSPPAPQEKSDGA